MNTDLEQLHEYQNRIETEKITMEAPKAKPKHETHKSKFIWTRH